MVSRACAAALAAVMVLAVAPSCAADAPRPEPQVTITLSASQANALYVFLRSAPSGAIDDAGLSGLSVEIRRQVQAQYPQENPHAKQ